MSQYKVKVKWSNGKKEFDNVDIDLAEPPTKFKETLNNLTGVPVDRQRLMCSGSMIKDTWPATLKIMETTTFMLMGSSEKLPEAPVEKPKFVEDMSENELAAALDLPAGLTNLGNTCYMSATVQCLKVVPELREALGKFDANLSIMSTLANQPDNESVTAALRDLYKSMDESANVEPVILLRVLHSTIPRFAQRAEGNVFQQQDANECWTELTRILQQHLKPINENSKYSNFIDEYFSGVFEGELKCDENPEEPHTKSNENFLQLSCFISQEVRYLQAGLMCRMKETLTKFSPSLERDASYTKVSRIQRLPAYLTIQMVRFHYKGNVQTNAKLLRDVKFPLILNAYELCTEELQEKLKQKKADDSGSNNTGFYELKAVLTHKGRSSTSGHYVAWVKKDEQWYKCDDDYVEPVESDEILKLSGGGDWHCAYVLLYGPTVVENTED